MPNFVYTRDIPDAPDNPSNDQPPMKDNTNSTDSILNEDHYSFNDTNGGLHKQSRYVNLSAIPGALGSTLGTLYAKLAISGSPSTESALFFTPGSSGNEYQLTRADTAFFNFFGKITANYSGVGVDYFGGWTTLPGQSGVGVPGALLVNYGYKNTPQTGQTITFPHAFTPGTFPFTIQLTVAQNGNSTLRTPVVKSGSETATSFQLEMSNSGQYTRVYWIAIGI